MKFGRKKLRDHFSLIEETINATNEYSSFEYRDYCMKLFHDLWLKEWSQ